MNTPMLRRTVNTIGGGDESKRLERHPETTTAGLMGRQIRERTGIQRPQRRDKAAVRHFFRTSSLFGTTPKDRFGSSVDWVRFTEGALPPRESVRIGCRLTIGSPVGCKHTGIRRLRDLMCRSKGGRRNDENEEARIPLGRFRRWWPIAPLTMALVVSLAGCANNASAGKSGGQNVPTSLKQNVPTSSNQNVLTSLKKPLLTSWPVSGAAPFGELIGQLVPDPSGNAIWWWGRSLRRPRLQVQHDNPSTKHLEPWEP